MKFVLVFTCLVLTRPACKKPLQRSPKLEISKNRKLHRRSVDIYKVFAQHRITEAIPLYLDAARQAEALGDDAAETKFLINAGGCQVLVFRYQDALATLERARKVTERSGNADYIASANANIASLYQQMGNYKAAEIAGERALSVLREDNPQYSRLIIPLAQVQAEQKNFQTAETLFRRAIDGAYQTGDMDTVAWAWDYLGTRYCLDHRFDEADRALTESLRIRKMFDLGDLGSSYDHLGMVRSGQGQYRSAKFLFASAVQELQKPGNITPAWEIYKERGKFYAKSGDLGDAWTNLGRAVNLARGWRTEVIANDANRTSAETELSELYALYVEVGNQYAARSGMNLARKTFQAAEENRATSLRALAERETEWHNKLPPIYWDKLAELQDAERNVIQEDSADNRAAAAHLRSLLDEMEAASGAPQHSITEPAALATQKKLDGDTVFLSFHLGERTSWLWAVTREHISVFPLPCRAEMTRRVREFEEYMRRGSPQADAAGSELYKVLFGVLPERYSRPERWLFSLDQELFSLTMPALVVRFESGRPVYLGALHALAATPGALMFASTTSHADFSGRLLGVGDAIYNRADPRWHSQVQFARLPERNGSGLGGGSFHFARLWGAADELAAVAGSWGPLQSVLLSGSDLSKGRLREELAQQPSVVHFATHILEANDQLHTGWIALSMGKNGRPEFLSPAEISAYRTNAGLVVLNGCSSGAAEIRASSGLMGLTRAWIASGAAGVLATRWPGPDDAGSFFTDFYKELRLSHSKGAAYALRYACRKSIAAGGWRAKPKYWASYFLTTTY